MSCYIISLNKSGVELSHLEYKSLFSLSDNTSDSMEHLPCLEQLSRVLRGHLDPSLGAILFSDLDLFFCVWITY